MDASGGASKKKGPLTAIIDAGILEDGAMVRYITAKGVLLGVGLARREGIEIEGARAPLGLSAFEKHCGSSAHRPCQFTFITDDTNLSTLVAKEKGTWEGKVAPGSKLVPAEKRAAIPEWGLSRQAAANTVPVPPVEDMNDEYCRICWSGGELLCCETCPAVFHAECLKLDIVPEGDWHCPLCTCGTCGHPNFGPHVDVDSGAGDKDVGDSAKGVIWVSAGPEGVPARWTGANSVGGSRPAVGIHADTFDRLWPELGAKLAAIQNAEMAREEAAAAAAAAANARPASATAAGAKGVVGPSSLTKGKLVNGERKPKKIKLGRFISMANRSETVATLTDALESWSIKSGDLPLRDLFKTLCPDLKFKGVEAALPVMAGLLWSMRGQDGADYDTEDDTPPGRKRAGVVDEDLSPDSPMSPSRQRRPGSGMPQRFRDAIMLSDEDSPEPEPLPRGIEGGNDGGHKSVLGKRKRPPSKFDLPVLSTRLQTLTGDLATPPPETLRHQSTSPDVDILSTSPLVALPVAVDLPSCAGHSDPSAQQSTILRGVNGAVGTANAAVAAVKGENVADDLTLRDDWYAKFLAGLPELGQAGSAPGLAREDLLIAQRLMAFLQESGYAVTPSHAHVTPGPGPAPTAHGVTVEDIHTAFANPHCVEAWAAHPHGPAIRYETAGTHTPGPALGSAPPVGDVSGAPVEDPRRNFRAVSRLVVSTTQRLAELTGRPPEIIPALAAVLGLPVDAAAKAGAPREISGAAPQAARPLGPSVPGALGAIPPDARPPSTDPLPSVEPLGTVPSWFTPSGVAALANAPAVQVRPPCQVQPSEGVAPPPGRHSPLSLNKLVSALLGDRPAGGRPMSADRDKAFAQLRTPADPRPTTTPAHLTGVTPLPPPVDPRPTASPAHLAGATPLPPSDGTAAATGAPGPSGPTPATPYGGGRPPWAGRPVHMPSSDPRVPPSFLPRDFQPEAMAAEKYRTTAMHAQPSFVSPLHPSEPHSEHCLAGPSPRDPQMQAVADPVQTLGCDTAASPAQEHAHLAPGAQDVDDCAKELATRSLVEPEGLPSSSSTPVQNTRFDGAAALAEEQAGPRAPGLAVGHPEPGSLGNEAKQSTREPWSELQSLPPSASNPVCPVISSDEDVSVDVVEPTSERAHIGNGVLAGTDVQPDTMGSSGSEQETSPAHTGVLGNSEEALRALRVEEGSILSDTASQGFLDQERDEAGQSSQVHEGVPAMMDGSRTLPRTEGPEQAGESPVFVAGSRMEASAIGPPSTSGFGPVAHSIGTVLRGREAEVLSTPSHRDVPLAAGEAIAPEAIGGNEVAAVAGYANMEGVEPPHPPLPPSVASAADLSGSAVERLEDAPPPSPPSNQDLAVTEDQVPAAEAFAVCAHGAASTLVEEGSPPALLAEAEQATLGIETSAPASQRGPPARLEVCRSEAAEGPGSFTALQVQAVGHLAVNGMLPGGRACAASVVDLGVDGVKSVGGTEALQTAGQESHTCLLIESLPPLPRQPWQSGPRGLPPQGDAAFEVDCPSCLRRFHLGCLPESDQQKAVKEGEVWYCSPDCLRVSSSLAATCMRGVMACAPAEDGIPVGWQLIRGASVASPKVCRGHAPQYPADATAELRKVLHAARHIAADALGTLNDCRSQLDLLPLLLAGTASVDRRLDFSGFHTAVLWLGGTVASVAVVSALGANLAEVPFIVTRPELRGNGLAGVLLGALEADLLSAGCQLVALPYVVLPPSVCRNMPATRTSAAAEVPMPVEPWPRKVGYEVLTLSQSLRITGLPFLSFPGTAFLSKELSADTLIKVPPVGTLELGPGCPVQALLKKRLLVAAPTAVSVPGGDVKADGASRKRRRVASDIKTENGEVALDNDNEVVAPKKARRELNGIMAAGTLATVAAGVEAVAVTTKEREQRRLVDVPTGTTFEGVSPEEGADVGPGDLLGWVGEVVNGHWEWEWEGTRQEERGQGFRVPVKVE